MLESSLEPSLCVGSTDMNEICMRHDFLPVQTPWLIAEILRPPATAPRIRHLAERRHDKDVSFINYHVWFEGKTSNI